MSLFRQYCRALGKKWWALMASAAFTVLAMYSGITHQSNTWVLVATGVISAVFIVFAGFGVWNDMRLVAEAESFKLAEECAKNAAPQIVTELLATFFDVPLEPSGRSVPTIVIYVFLRLVLTHGPDTTLKASYLSLRIAGVEYRRAGEASWQPVSLRHRTDFRSGSDEPIGRDTVSTALNIGSVNTLNPLKKGIHRDLVAIFRMDGVRAQRTDNSDILKTTNFRVSVVDAFNQPHGVNLSALTIPIAGSVRQR